MKITLKTILLYKKKVLRENHVNRESKSLDLTIELYIYYGGHEAPRSCNTTVYLSVSTHCTIYRGTTSV